MAASISGGDGATGTGRYRVDELARAAGTTVRNVRAYQERGLLPPPRREGRVAWYTDAHLARLRIVASLLERGYTVANIAEILAAWERGQDLAALLGLEAALAGPWEPAPWGGHGSRGTPELDAAALAAVLLGDTGEEQAAGIAEAAARAVTLGILSPAAGGRWAVRNPAALEVGAILVRAGVPLAAVLDAAQRLHDDVADVARLFVDLVDTNVFAPLGEPLPPAAVAGLSALVERLRPLAAEMVRHELAGAMQEAVGRRLGEHLARRAPAGPRP